MKDLVILVADLDMEMALRGILNRSSYCSIQYDLFRHPQRDSGCFGKAHEYMRRYLLTHHYLMVIFDCHGCGAEHQNTPDEIERDVEIRLGQNGWQDRCCVIVPYPELESWVWSDSPHVEIELGWRKRQPPLKQWLVQKGIWNVGAIKPANPKDAMRAVLKEVRKPVSPAIFSALAEKVDFSRCSDRAFDKLRRTLQTWFG